MGNSARSIRSFAALIGAMGMYLTSRAYADLKLSLSAASCAHLSVLGGRSRNDFADLLEISCDSLCSNSIWPDRKSRRRRVMHFLRLVPLCPGLGVSGFGHSISCSKMKGRIHMGSGLYSSVPFSFSSFGAWAHSTHVFNKSSKQSVTSSSSSCLILRMRDWRKEGSAGTWELSHERPSVQ